MIDLIITLSIGIFLLIPYYMGVFLMNKKAVILHIVIWCVYNIAMSFVFFIKTNEVFSIPVCVLVFSLLYFFFSYIHYVRDILQDLDFEKIRHLLSLKYAKSIIQTAMIIVILLAVVDCILVLCNINDSLHQVYFITLLAISCVQILVYCAMYKRRI